MGGKATVVTAYYPIKSKHPKRKYIEWICDFWPATSCQLVFFTEPAIASELQQVLMCGGKRDASNTRIYGVPFKELSAFKKVPLSVWKWQMAMDPERDVHTAEVYALWFEKKEFVQRAIDANPFGSECFVWCDAGICRSREWSRNSQIVDNFPLENKIPRGQMLVLQMEHFFPEDFIPDSDGIYGDFTVGRTTVGGGILASDVAGWKRWDVAYDAMVQKYYHADRFIGKDQNIMGSMILADSTLALPVYSPTSLGAQSLIRWFYLLFFLSFGSQS